MFHPDTIADRRAQNSGRYPQRFSSISTVGIDSTPHVYELGAALRGTSHTMRVVIEVDIGTWQNTGALASPTDFSDEARPRFGEAGTYGGGSGREANLRTCMEYPRDGRLKYACANIPLDRR